MALSGTAHRAALRADANASSTQCAPLYRLMVHSSQRTPVACSGTMFHVALHAAAPTSSMRCSFVYQLKLPCAGSWCA